MDAFTMRLSFCIVDEFARLPFFDPFGPPELVSRKNSANGVVLRYPPLPPPSPRDQPARAHHERRMGLTTSAWFWFLAVRSRNEARRQGVVVRRERESGPGGLTREVVDRPLPSNSPHDHMILRVDLVDSHGRWWKRPCPQTAPECDQVMPWQFE
jgi:hypothetical protein